jgi:hypothetical protein
MLEKIGKNQVCVCVGGGGGCNSRMRCRLCGLFYFGFFYVAISPYRCFWENGISEYRRITYRYLCNLKRCQNWDT